MRLVCFLQAIAIRKAKERLDVKSLSQRRLGIVTYGEHARLIVNNTAAIAMIRSEDEGEKILGDRNQSVVIFEVADPGKNQLLSHRGV